jgi:predicted dehydrogenase
MDEPLIIDIAIHHFDYMRGILGLEPATVRARSYNPSWSRFAGNASALVDFRTSSGTVIAYSGSWDSRRPHTTWDGTWEIHGSRGSLLWEDNKVLLYPHANTIGETVFRATALERIGDVLEVPFDPLEEEERWGTIREFVNAIREGRKPETHGADNIGSLAMVFGAVESARNDGAEVDLVEFMSRELKKSSA